MNTDSTLVFQWSRIQNASDWFWPIAVFLVCVWLIWRLYRKDAHETSAPWRYILPALRIFTLVLILVFWLQPTWRVEREVEQNSQLAVFLDTSLSMGLPNADFSGAVPAAVTANGSTNNSANNSANGSSNENVNAAGSSDVESRYDAMVKLLADSPLIQELNKKHDIHLIAVDTQSQQIASLPKDSLSADGAAKSGLKSESADPQKTDRTEGNAETDKTAESNDANSGSRLPNWKESLMPRGLQTILTDDMVDWLQTNRQAPIAGALLLSDGTQTAGSDVERLVNLAKTMELPFYTIGFGSENPVANLRVYDVQTPKRVQPNDPFTINALIQGQGLTQPATARVELYSQAYVGGVLQPQVLVEVQETVIPKDGSAVSVPFQITPEATGKFLYTVNVPPLEVNGKPKDANLTDNRRDAEIEVIDRKTRVLILAGGPTREYQFITTSFFRDKSMETDILLQSAQPGLSQEATRILNQFPANRTELFEYDCILAVDPDWKKLTAEQVAMLDDWVSHNGGGMVFIAGPVFMGETIDNWSLNPTYKPIRAMYPVELPESMAQNTYVTSDVWPLEFSRDGLEADFLRLGVSAAESRQIWTLFPGVYGYYPAVGLKPGATPLAFFSNPDTKINGQQPVLIASQFYGSGRVVYIGTGEFWRLRKVVFPKSAEDQTPPNGPDLFVQFYTQIVRYASYGRMSQQSTRGQLLLTKEKFFPGDIIEISANLLDGQQSPYEAPEVTVDAFLPNGKIQRIPLQPNPQKTGSYVGSFSSMVEGTVRLELPIPDSEERLTRRIEIVMSDQERENPQRDQLFLETLAVKTGGKAFSNTNPDVQKLPQLIRARTRTATLFAAADPNLQQRFLLWLMLAMIGVLCLEWVIRRLLKLA